MKTIALGAALMLVVCAAPAAADEAASIPSPAAAPAAAPAAKQAKLAIGSESPEFGTLAKKTTYSLAALTMLFLLATGTIKRFTQKSNPTSSENEIEVLSRKSLGPRQSLLVVSVRGQTFFLSQAAEGVSLISELDGESIFRAASEAELELMEQQMKTAQRG